MGILALHCPFRTSYMLLLLLALQWGGEVLAQKHQFPPHQSPGVSGPEPHSFIIGWAPVRGAIAYEYVLTDNEYCFVGCSGDTRNRIVSDTFAIEYDMQEDIDYYWITRIYLDNGDTTAWTLISSFRSVSWELQPFVVVAPNPVVDQLHFEFDWAAAPDARAVVFTLMDSDGKQAMPEQTIIKKGIATRFESHDIPVAGLPAGMYLATLRVQETGGVPERTRIIKVVIQ
jgi:hypothetical protein